MLKITHKKKRKILFIFDDIFHAMRQFNIIFRHELRNTIELYQNNKKDIFIVFIGVCDPKKPRQKPLQGKHIRREKSTENIFIFVKSYKMVMKILFSCDAFCV